MKTFVLLTAMIISSATMLLAQPAQNHYYSGHQGGNVGYNSAYNNHGPPMMNQQEFQYALQSVRSQRYESSKLSMARQIIRENMMKAHQVKRLVQVFSFESNRLTLAKEAYMSTRDKHNYHIVSSALRYHSSVRDLEQFIARQGGQQQDIVVNNQLPSGTTYSGGVVPADVQIGSGNVGINHGAADGPMGGHHGGQGFNGGHDVIGNGPSGMGYQAGPQAMCVNTFARLKQSIARQCFDRDKLTIAKQGTRGQILYSHQVLELVHMFTFESNKLKFAKYAYLLVCDTHNYYVVNDAFTFSSSIRELECYIRSV